MNRLLRAICIAVVAAASASCTTPRAVEADYAEYLSDYPVGEIILPTTGKAAGYFLPAATRRLSYRIPLPGEEPWVVQIGRMLDDTLRSAAVQAAFEGLVDAGKSLPATGNTLVFEIRSYAFKDYVAQLTIEVALRRDAVEIFRKSYTTDGRSQGGSVFSGIVFGQKAAIQQSTRLAFDRVLVRLVDDLDTLPSG